MTGTTSPKTATTRDVVAIVAPIDDRAGRVS